LSGYSEDEIGIAYSGIRPGEKLFEELLNDNERQSEHVFPKIFVGKAEPVSALEMEDVLGRLLEMSDEELKGVLVGLANGKIIDDFGTISVIEKEAFIPG